MNDYINCFRVSVLMTILLNTIVLLTKYRSKKVTPVDCYIIALSTVDIVQAVLGHPWVMAAASRHRWPTSPQGNCVIYVLSNKATFP